MIFRQWLSALGVTIGALFVEYTSWHWIFWFIALIALPISMACIILIPATPRQESHKQSKLGLAGVFALTRALTATIRILYVSLNPKLTHPRLSSRSHLVCFCCHIRINRRLEVSRGSRSALYCCCAHGGILCLGYACGRKQCRLVSLLPCIIREPHCLTFAPYVPGYLDSGFTLTSRCSLALL